MSRRKLKQEVSSGVFLLCHPVYMANGKKGSGKLPPSEARTRVAWLGELRRILLDPSLADGPDDLFWNCSAWEHSEYRRRFGGRAKGLALAEQRRRERGEHPLEDHAANYRGPLTPDDFGYVPKP